jgi:hypothetical protein
MSTWDKFVNKVINKDKGTGEPKPPTCFEEIVKKEYNVEIEDLWKLNTSQLQEIVRSYDKALAQARRVQAAASEEATVLRDKCN